MCDAPLAPLLPGDCLLSDGVVDRIDGVLGGLSNLTAAGLSPGEPPVAYRAEQVGALGYKSENTSSCSPKPNQTKFSSVRIRVSR
jgi:hypothetical protein